MTLFRGLCAFPVTPADPAGRVDARALRTDEAVQAPAGLELA